MRHPLTLTAWTATLGLLALAPARAQDEEENPQEAARLFIDEHAGEDGVLSLEETKAALAEIELLVVVDRKLHAADYRLEVLRHHLEERLEDLAAPDPELVEAATLGLVAHVELQLARGYVKDAWNEFEPPPAVAEGADVPPDVAAELAIWNDPRVEELRELVARRRGGGGPRDPAEDGREGGDAPLVGLRVQGDRIEEAVRDAVARKQYPLVLELGAPAAPALAKLVEEDLDVLPQDYRFDPLYLLVAVDPETAGQVVLRNRGGGGFFWKKRVARALEQADAFRRVESGQAHYEGRYSYPSLLKVIEWLVDDPEVGDDVLPHLSSIVQLGAFTPALLETLAQALVSDSPVRRHEGLDLLRQAETHEKLRPVLERALASGDPEVRGRAAGRLEDLGWSDVLLGHVDDPDRTVRMHVVTMLRRRQVDRREVHPPDTPKHRAAVEHLLADPDPDVRMQAIQAVWSFPTRSIEVEGVLKPVDRILDAPPLSILLPLTRDPSVDVRRSLPYLCRSLDQERAVPLLTVLVGDEDRGVVNEATVAVTYLDVVNDPSAALAVLRARHGNEKVPFQRSGSAVERFAFPRGRELFARWVIEEQDPLLLESFIVYVTSENEGVEATAASLDPATLAELLATLDRFPETAPHVVDLLSHGVPEDSRSALLDLPESGDASSRLRAFAAVAGAGEERARWLPALVAALRDPWWASRHGQRYSTGNELWVLMKRLAGRPPEDRNALALAVVQDPAVHDEVAAYVAHEVAHENDIRSPGAVDAARAVITRWFDAERSPRAAVAVRQALAAMAEVPELRDDALIARAIDDPDLAHAAIDAIAALRDPAMMPLLAKVIREKVGSNYWFEAAQATATFLSDDAAELLLEAAALTEDVQERQWCMDELERIREYHVARDYWRRSKSVERARDEAVAELMELLDDEDEALRVQAIRGLGTFKAVEAIPTLIRMMKGGSPAVRTEIEQALERINAGDGDEQGD